MQPITQNQIIRQALDPMKKNGKQTFFFFKRKNYLRMISNSSFHGTTSVIVLHSESNIGRQSSIILWNGAFHLIRTKTRRGEKSSHQEIK